MDVRNIKVDRYFFGKNVFDIIKCACPGIRTSEIYKAFDRKDVKLDGKTVKKNIRPAMSSTVTVYGIRYEKAVKAEDIKTVYEDDNILIADKPAGLPSTPVSDQIKGWSLLELLKTGSSEIELCHRLDLNTQGLVLAAKTRQVADEVKSLLNNNAISKYYTALVFGRIKPEKARLNSYLFKDSKLNRVYISDSKKKGYLPISTEYRLLEYISDDSLIEVRLLTGRTHQIRAQFAHMGHPVIGDGKYGRDPRNKHIKHQKLCACKLVFEVPHGSLLNYLDGRTFKAAHAF